MRFKLIAALSLCFVCQAGAQSVTSNSSINSSSTSINNSVTSSTVTSSDGSSSVSSNTSITSSNTGSGTTTTTCSTINGQQQCEVTCERPRVARCVQGTAGAKPSCTCQKPRKKRKRNPAQ